MYKCLIYTILSISILACNNSNKKPGSVDSTGTGKTPDTTRSGRDTTSTGMGIDDPVLMANARSIIGYIRDKKFRELSMFVSPQHGISFSADGFINQEDISFTRRQLAEAWNDTTHYAFPLFRDDAEPMLFREYYEAHIYTKDFASAKIVEINTIRRGPTPGMINMKEVYPDAAFVSFYIPAPPEAELDWASLHLVFVRDGMASYLRHIVHDRWTP